MPTEIKANSPTDEKSSARVQRESFNVGEEIARLTEGGGGAVASFVGVVRGGEVREMELEHYPEMTARALENIIAESRRRWPIIDALLIHRFGKLRPGESIVLVAVSAAHRAEAFSACEFIVDYLKTRAPFWKKEFTADGSRWVRPREDDFRAAAKWKK